METKDWLAEVSLTTIVDMIASGGKENHNIVVRCPGYGTNGRECDLKLTFNELFLFPMSIFVQALIPFKLDIACLFHNLKANPKAQKALFHRLLQDYNVDRYSVQQLITAWKTVVEKKIAIFDTQHKCEFNEDVANAKGYAKGIKDALNLPLTQQPGVKSFCKRIESFCKTRMEQMFGQFCNPNEPIFGPYDMRQIVLYLQKRLPNLYEQYMGRMSYREKIEKERNENRKYLTTFKRGGTSSSNLVVAATTF